MKNIKENFKLVLIGLVSGVLNGLFGAGGGTVCVPLLTKCKISEKSAHATSVVIMLALSLLSAVIYIVRGDVLISDSYVYLVGGIVGAVVGATLLKKLKTKPIKIIFGAVIIFAAVRMFLK